MTYEYHCPMHGVVELEADIRNAPGQFASCPIDGYMSRRIYTAPCFTEDRLRLRKTPPHTHKGVTYDNWSYALGAPMPESRAELRRVEKEKGIAFDNQLTPRERTLVEYADHVAKGGERLPNEVVNPTVIENKPLSWYMRQRGYRLDK